MSADCMAVLSFLGPEFQGPNEMRDTWYQAMLVPCSRGPVPLRETWIRQVE